MHGSVGNYGPCGFKGDIGSKGETGSCGPLGPITGLRSEYELVTTSPAAGK